MIQALSVLALVGLVAALALASRRHRLLLAATAILASLAVGWVAAALAVWADYLDADGFVDCGPSCTAFQTAVNAMLFYGPPAAAVLLFAAGVLGLRSRSGRSS